MDLKKEPKTYQITLTFRGPLEERKEKMDELTNCFEYDIANVTPGRIWFGNYYIDCYIKDLSSKVSSTRNSWTEYGDWNLLSLSTMDGRRE